MAGRLGLFAIVLGLALLAAACDAETAGGDPDALVLERTIPLAASGGRIDHLSIDPAHHRLFVAELGDGAVEAIDLATGRSLGRITGLREPQGLAYLPALDQLAVASGGDGVLRFYRAADLALLGSVALGDDADNLRVEPGAGRVVVGYGSGALAVIDPASRAVVLRLPLPAHPESFQIEGARVFVNVPDAHRIVVGDLASGRVIASWPAGYGWNFPMDLDASSGTIAVVYRLPTRLQVLDAGSGQVKLDLPTCGDADDIFSDARRGRLYVICGSGAVDVIGRTSRQRDARIVTRPGARTGLFSPELDRLFVAARGGPGGPAALLVFRPGS